MNRFLGRILKLLCFVTLLVFNFFLLHKIYFQNSNFSSFISRIEQIKLNREIDGVKLNESIIKDRESNKWILNNRLYQYSSSLIVKNGILKHIEGIIILTVNYNLYLIKYNIRCILKFSQNGSEIELRVNYAYNLKSGIVRVICDIDQIISDFKGTLVAIIDSNDFKSNFESSNLAEEDLDNLHFKWPRNMINYQIPRIIEVPINKIEQIAHCVHYTYDTTTDDVHRILNWIELQRQIGVKKIVFYNANMHTLLENAIGKIYDDEFIEIRPYKIQYEAICNLDALNKLRKTDILKYQVLNDHCEDAFYNFFDNPSLDANNRERHQRVTSNDCFSSLQQLYKYVSYYNYDEIIYPRTLHSIRENYLNCDGSIFCKHKRDYEAKINLYEYINNLMNKSLTSSSSISFIYFQHAFYLEFNYYSKMLLSNLNEILTRKEAKILHFNFKNKYGHYFKINKSDYTYIHDLILIFTQLSCIEEQFNRNLTFKIDAHFKRFLYLVTNADFQKGKCIYNTDNVDGIFEHETNLVSASTQKFIVDINDGVLSHFQNDLYKNAYDMKSSIRNLRIDYEYYIHLITEFSDICFKI